MSAKKLPKPTRDAQGRPSRPTLADRRGLRGCVPAPAAVAVAIASAARAQAPLRGRHRQGRVGRRGLTGEIADLEGEIARIEGAIKGATAVRTKEKAEFEAIHWD